MLLLCAEFWKQPSALCHTKAPIFSSGDTALDGTERLNRAHAEEMERECIYMEAT